MILERFSSHGRHRQKAPGNDDMARKSTLKYFADSFRFSEWKIVLESEKRFSVPPPGADIITVVSQPNPFRLRYGDELMDGLGADRAWDEFYQFRHATRLNHLGEHADRRNTPNPSITQIMESQKPDRSHLAFERCSCV
jgi:hypothetical protein